MRAKYYTKILYPIQDKVISVFKGSPFYLTGGTALSRGYFNHRYSDDLDFFINDSADFKNIAQQQIVKIYSLFEDLKVKVYPEMFRLSAQKDKLKIDIVNYTYMHPGKRVNHPVLGALDSKENILANKLTALVDRAAPKDIVDIYFLLKDGMSLKQALTDVRSKSVGISPVFVARILTKYDYNRIDNNIEWVNPISTKEIKEYFKGVILDIVYGQEHVQHSGQDIEHKRRHR